MSATKSERLSLRLDKLTKKKIEQAATVAQCSVNSFILSSVLEKAEEVIRKHEEMVLSDRDRDIFFEALLNPPPPNEALIDAFAEHSAQVESDV